MKVKAVYAAPALLLAVFLCNLGIRNIPESTLGSQNDPYIVMSLIQLFVIAVPAMIFCRLRGGDYMKKLRLKPPSPSHAAFMLFALLFLFFGSAGINYLVYTAFPDANPYVAYDSSSGVGGGLYLVLTMAILPAITEEFLFRGVVVAEYESKGVPAAVFMSSVTFAMLHFSITGLPAYLFSGLVLAAVLYTTRSVFAAMIVHMLNNTATIFFGDLVYRVVSSQGVTLFCIVLITLILLSAILMFGESERIYTGYGVLNEDSSYAGKRRRGAGTAGLFQSIVNPVFAALVILYIIAAATATA